MQFCLFCFCIPSAREKRSTLKGKNLLPIGANSFLLEKTTFQKEDCAQESKQEVTKVVSLVNDFENLSIVSIRPKEKKLPILGVNSFLLEQRH